MRFREIGEIGILGLFSGIGECLISLNPSLENSQTIDGEDKAGQGIRFYAPKSEGVLM